MSSYVWLATILLLGVVLSRWLTERRLGAGLGFVVGGLFRVRRRHVEQAMQRAGIQKAAGHARRMYASLGWGVFELIGLLLAPRRKASARVALPLGVLDDVLARGRGAVIATAHTGNWDVVACAAAERTPLTVVTKHLSVGWIDRLWQSFRRRRGVRLVGEGAAARAALGALGRGELVAMMIDQAPLRRRATTTVSFLGQTAAVDLAPALIAMRARAPLVTVFACRDERGGHRVEVAGVLEPPSRPSREWAETAARRSTEWLDSFTRRHPDQWLWMHRRWRLAGVPLGD